MVGLGDLEGLFRSKRFYNSISQQEKFVEAPESTRNVHGVPLLIWATLYLFVDTGKKIHARYLGSCVVIQESCQVGVDNRVRIYIYLFIYF